MQAVRAVWNKNSKSAKEHIHVLLMFVKENPHMEILEYICETAHAYHVERIKLYEYLILCLYPSY